MNEFDVQIRDLHFMYPDGTRVLSGIDLAIRPGEKIAIVGANGAGKSTLLLHLNGILSPERGEVVIQGLPATRENLREIRRRVGVVFQNPDDQLFHATVFEDAAFGPRNMGLVEDEVQTRVKEALAAVGMEGFEARTAHRLSFGQRKRVAAATVISMRPSIWVFDEPSANLDYATHRLLADFMISLRSTLIIVTQDLAFAAETCDRVAVLADGRVAMDGPAQEILSQTERLREFNLGFGYACRYCREYRAK